MTAESPAIIVVIDDDDGVRTAVSRLIRSVGLEVEAFPSARDFLDREASNRPSCIEDHFGNLQTPPGVGLDIGKNRVFGVGPEIMLPIATSTKLIAEIDVRYFWETGARSTVAGQTLLVTATFPVPSLRIR